MSSKRLDNLKKMKATASTKEGYGIEQINVEYSSSEKLKSDARAMRGKLILRKKVYG